MKKIILTILIIITILSINVLAVDIDIGCAAIDRGSSLASKTLVNKGNPANADGTITNVEIYAVSGYTLTNCEVATFYCPDPTFYPDKLSTRDYEFIGDVVGGSKQTFAVDLTVYAGDYIGIYASLYLERETSGGEGVWYISGDTIPCTNQAFSFNSTWVVSLYGYSAVGWAHKWNTATISKWNGQVITKWNGLQ